jgi:hypothetical protein
LTEPKTEPEPACETASEPESLISYLDSSTDVIQKMEQEFYQAKSDIISTEFSMLSTLYHQLQVKQELETQITASPLTINDNAKFQKALLENDHASIQAFVRLLALAPSGQRAEMLPTSPRIQ